MILSENIDPCQQIRHAIVRHLQGLAGGFSRPLPITQIREILDVSGDPKDAAGIVVGAENAGDHNGQNTGGVLIDIIPKIVCFSHVNEDPDGSVANALVSDVRTAIESITYDLQGYKVAWNGSWRTGETILDGSYRQIELTATLPLVKKIYRANNSNS